MTFTLNFLWENFIIRLVEHSLAGWFYTYECMLFKLYIFFLRMYVLYNIYHLDINIRALIY